MQDKRNENLINISLTTGETADYFMYRKGISPVKRLYVKNTGAEDIEDVIVGVSSDPPFLIPAEIAQDVIPRKSMVNFDADITLSPVFLVSLEDSVDGTISVTVKKGKDILAREERKVRVTAYETCSYAAREELIAGFVHRSPFVNEILAASARKLADWRQRRDIRGYAGVTKNEARYLFASIYASIAALSLIPSKEEEGAEVKLSGHARIKESGVVKPIETALLYASAAEAAGLNALVLRSGEDWYVGVWLKDECFPETVYDTADFILKRTAAGVNDISVVGVNDIFGGISFEASEKKSRAALKDADKFRFAVDVRRARIAKIYPLPERVPTAAGYDLIEERAYDQSGAPDTIKEYGGDIKVKGVLTKEKQWERRLLDLSMKNGLLNFRPTQSSVKLLAASAADFVRLLDTDKEYTVSAAPDGCPPKLAPFENGGLLRPLADLIAMDMRGGRLHTTVTGKEHERAVQGIYRKDRTFIEESGTNSLNLAVGFLKWRDKTDNGDKYSPLFLYPVQMTKSGGEKYTLSVNGDDIRLNNTLLEFLYQEFGLDMRGLQDAIGAGTPDTVLAIISRIKKELVDREGWDITDDVYLTSLSFSNYLMLKDIRNKLDVFRQSRIISGLLDQGRNVFVKEDHELSSHNADDSYGKDKIYLPISADSSQYSAIVDSLSKSFVLHGPPGTGKSQTITNIIANNILRGRRVLFVAEKMAALSVVKKRLDDIGIGDFCLELHSNKTNKAETVRRILNTMRLAESEDAGGYAQRAKEISELIDGVNASMEALHRKRNLGISVYVGILRYLENEDAPSSLAIDSVFHEKLTESSLNKYESILTELIACAKECGEISHSPFKSIGYFEYGGKWRARAERIIDVVNAESAHIKSYAAFIANVFGMRTANFTESKLASMYRICKAISEGGAVGSYYVNRVKYDDPYGSVASYLANKRKKDELYAEYSAHYSELPDDIDGEALLDGNDKRRKRAAQKLAKRLDRLAADGASPLGEEEAVALVTRILECERSMSRQRDILVKLFSRRDIDGACVALEEFYRDGSRLYADFSREIFDSAAERAVKERNSLLGYYIGAYEMFTAASKEFAEIFKIDDRSVKKNRDLGELVSFVKRVDENLDLMPSWCKYNKLVKECGENGLEFAIEPLRDGAVTSAELLKSFRKSVYGNFVASEIALDKNLSEFSGKTLEEKIDKLRLLTDEFEGLTRREMYYKLVAAIPRSDDEGAHNLEMMTLSRAEKNNMKGNTLRKLFTEIPTVMKYACPCMLMSPVSVTQFLDIDQPKFDLVVFDEASQMPTCEAIGAIARGNNVIVVGDPKQLPPTKFFSSDYHDEENPELEDLESILDDCLSLGMPERHLLWHYRSKDESLIAFSNAMYYDNKLLTFPSPNELGSKVKLVYVDGVYERGGSKRNRKEAEALVAEVIRRLKNGTGESIGIVTFNTAQQNFIEDLLQDAVRRNKLAAEAYDVAEPIFVKNLENVQGDERDVILFSVGYGVDAAGKLSLNFGPLNQAGGYRRLNVAITRARSEMLVFSSITGNMIDLARTDNAGVKNLKAFLEYAERGREMLALDSKTFKRGNCKNIGWYIARDLREKGYDCEYDVGVSDFKIDVAVIDPNDKSRYVLAVMCDGKSANKVGSVRDRMAMDLKVLKQLGWNVYFMWTVNYLNNGKREINKLKDYIAAITSKKAPTKKSLRESVSKYRRAYRQAPLRQMKAGAEYVLDKDNYEQISLKAAAVIETEQPVEEEALLSRLCGVYNINKTAKKAYARLTEIVRAHFSESYGGKTFYRFKNMQLYTFFRPIDDGKGKREIDCVHPSEIIACCKCVLENYISLDKETLKKNVLELLNYARRTRIAPIWLDMCIDEGVKTGQLIMSLNDTVTM